MSQLIISQDGGEGEKSMWKKKQFVVDGITLTVSPFFEYFMQNVQFDRDSAGFDYISCFRVKQVSKLRTAVSSQLSPLINITASVPSAISERPQDKKVLPFCFSFFFKTKKTQKL